jgi:hypothetical protein
MTDEEGINGVTGTGKIKVMKERPAPEQLSTTNCT